MHCIVGRSTSIILALSVAAAREGDVYAERTTAFFSGLRVPLRFFSPDRPIPTIPEETTEKVTNKTDSHPRPQRYGFRKTNLGASADQIKDFRQSVG